MRTEIKLITPAIATQLLSRNKDNRRIRQRTVEDYASQMSKNLWRLTGQGISIDEKQNILDGQHRLLAVIKANKPIQFLVCYDVPRDTFNVYDTGLVRPLSDIFDISQACSQAAITSSIVVRYMELSSRCGKITGSGSSAKQLNISKQEVLEKYLTNSEFWNKVVKLSANCYTKYRLYTTSEIGSFYAYLILDCKKDESTVRKFFMQLFSIEQDSYTCTSTLRDFLMKIGLTNRKLDKKVKHMILIKTWNYFIRKKDVSRMVIGIDEEQQDIL